MKKRKKKKYVKKIKKRKEKKQEGLTKPKGRRSNKLKHGEVPKFALIKTLFPNKPIKKTLV